MPPRLDRSAEVRKVGRTVFRRRNGLYPTRRYHPSLMPPILEHYRPSLAGRLEGWMDVRRVMSVRGYFEPEGLQILYSPPAHAGPRPEM